MATRLLAIVLFVNAASSVQMRARVVDLHANNANVWRLRTDGDLKVFDSDANSMIVASG